MEHQVHFFRLFLTGNHPPQELLQAATAEQLDILLMWVSEVVFSESAQPCPAIAALLNCPHPSQDWLDADAVSTLRGKPQEIQQALLSLAPALHHVVALFI